MHSACATARASARERRAKGTFAKVLYISVEWRESVASEGVALIVTVDRDVLRPPHPNTDTPLNMHSLGRQHPAHDHEGP